VRKSKNIKILHGSTGANNMENMQKTIKIIINKLMFYAIYGFELKALLFFSFCHLGQFKLFL
jgi:hypothetical protein